MRQRLRALFAGGSEVGGGQEGADQHHQQIDFHVFLRCVVAACNKADARRVPVPVVAVA